MLNIFAEALLLATRLDRPSTTERHHPTLAEHQDHPTRVLNRFREAGR